ncbi:MAG: 4Fe-4S binding protein [Candidatus Acetothermia bacterium]|jgi:2-oxoglutarate ferredoxin oxidoreductase subunit delta|nr:4Fe-4S binding protein [Candidatus Acetothermia bacterium]
MIVDEKAVAKRWRVPKGHVYVLEDVCKGCGFCIEFCPRKVLVRADHYNAKGYHPPEVVDAEACVMCGFCELICPDFAIWTEKGETGKLASGMNPDDGRPTGEGGNGAR